jgi:hypothetical protein
VQPRSSVRPHWGSELIARFGGTVLGTSTYLQRRAADRSLGGPAQNRDSLYAD